SAAGRAARLRARPGFGESSPPRNRRTDSLWAFEIRRRPIRASRASSLSCRANFSESFIPNSRIPSCTGPARPNRRVQVERLTHLTPEHLAIPIAESEAQGLSFVRRLADEWISGTNRFDRPGEALFSAREGAAIVAVAGLNVDPYVADPRIGRVRHLYVLASHRRRGLAARLVTEIIAAAR